MWRPSEVGLVVAERELTLEIQQGLNSVTLTIGKPVQAPNAAPNDPWWCPVLIKGLDDHVQSIAGEDSLQALVLGLEFARTALPELASRIGGKVYLEENDLDCVNPARALIDAYSRTSAEALELVRRLTDALDQGDAEVVKSIQQEIETLRHKCHV